MTGHALSLHDVLLAGAGLPDEPALISAAQAGGFRVLRRCLDGIDLLAAATVDERAVVVTTLAGLEGAPSAVERIGMDRLVGLLIGDGDAARWAVLGVTAPVDARRAPADVWRAVGGALPATVRRVPAVESAGGRQPPAGGRLVAVWGPSGAPGRTTIAAGLAEAWADTGLPTLLVDADTYAPAAALALGVVDPGGGLLRAARLAEAGCLTPQSLAASAVALAEHWHLLAGVGRPDRWPQVRMPDAVWPACRSAFAVTVVDVGPGLGGDEGALGPRRHALAASVLADADVVVVVADASAQGAARLAWAWSDLTGAAPLASMVVLANRSPRGGRRAWAEAVHGLGVHAPIRAVPADPRGVSRALARGRSLGEVARRSPVRRCLARLAPALLSP